MAIVTPMTVLAPALEAERMAHKTHSIRADRRKYLARAFRSGDERKLRKGLNSFFTDTQVKMSALHKAGERQPNIEGRRYAAKSLDPRMRTLIPLACWPQSCPACWLPDH